MNRQEALEIIRSNWPDKLRYTMLDEALKVAVADLERNVFAGLDNHTDATIRASEKEETAPSASTNNARDEICALLNRLDFIMSTPQDIGIRMEEIRNIVRDWRKLSPVA